MPEVREVQVTFDCAEPERVGRFWCEVLGEADEFDESCLVMQDVEGNEFCLD
jgi:hypothetical protein